MPRTMSHIVIDDFSKGINDDANYLLDKRESSGLQNIGPMHNRKLTKIDGFSHFGTVEGYGVDEFDYATVTALTTAWTTTYANGANVDDLNVPGGTKIRIKGVNPTTASDTASVTLKKTMGILTKAFTLEVKINHISNKNTPTDGLIILVDNGTVRCAVRFHNGNIKVYDYNAATWNSLTTFNDGKTHVYQFVFDTDIAANDSTVTLYRNNDLKASAVIFRGTASTVAGEVVMAAAYKNNQTDLTKVKPIDIEIWFLRIWPAGEITALDRLRTSGVDAYFAVIPTESSGSPKGVLHKYDSSGDVWEPVTGGIGGDVFTVGVKCHTIQINDELYFFNGTDNVHSVDSGGVVTDRTVPANGIPKGKYAIINVGRLFVSGTSANPNRLLFSDANDAHTFQAASYWDIGASAITQTFATNYDYIVGLNTVKTQVVALRAFSIHALDVSGSTSAWFSYPISQSVGSVGDRATFFLGNDILFVGSDKKLRTVIRTAQDTFLPDKINTKINLDNLNISQLDLCAVTVIPPFMWIAIPTDNNTYNDKVIIRNIDYGSFMLVSDLRPVLFKVFQIGNEDVLFTIEDHVAKILRSDSSTYDLDGISLKSVYTSPEFDFGDISKDKVLKRVGVITEALDEDIDVLLKYNGESEFEKIGTLSRSLSGALIIYDDYIANDAVPVVLTKPYPVLREPGEVEFTAGDDRRRFRKIQVKLRSTGAYNKNVKINQVFLEALVKNRRTDILS